MRIRWIRLCRWMLGILGIGAYVSSCEGVVLRCEYGVPFADYSIKGKVVDSKSGSGVAGIEVSQWENPRDTTGADGSFELSGEMFPTGEAELILRDIDPAKDGNYKTDTVKVQLKQVKEGEGWYSGEYEAKNVVLKVEKQ